MKVKCILQIKISIVGKYLLPTNKPFSSFTNLVLPSLFEIVCINWLMCSHREKWTTFEYIFIVSHFQ